MVMALESPKQSANQQKSVSNEAIASRISPWLANLAYFLGYHLIMPFYFRRIEVIGQENLPKDGPVILAPTHRSRWDALVVPYSSGRLATGRDLRFMVSIDEIKGIQGWFIRRLGGFAINPKHPAISSIRHGVELMLNREMLVIFPEGNIFQDGLVHRLKPGLARLALQAESNEENLGVKIVPMIIDYRPRVPRWKTNITVNIGSPLSVANYCQDSPKKAAQVLTADLEKALKELDLC
ncbi:MAG: 1-acyl-sn-glycerol-3-phosphate acyltransferase [Okeania sp. SIO2H7]|nr:1-acyl-sn-glycerol-3-phosphate acyltransferase [Okeania sp. SIO2H7]